MSESQRWMLLILAAFVIGLLYLLEPILTPFLTAMVLAYLGDPVADWLEDHGLTRRWAVIVVFLVLSIALLLLIILLLPLLGRQLDSLVNILPALINWLQQAGIPWLERTLDVELSNSGLEQIRQSLTEHWQQTGNLVAMVVKQVSLSGLALVAWVANLVLIPVVTFYLLLDWDRLKLRIQEILPRQLEPTVTQLAMECDEVLGAFVRGQMMVMLSLGLIYAVGLWLVGLKLALLLGILAGLANIVPYMGFIVGIAAAGIAAFVQFHDWVHLLGVAAVFAVGQMIEGMVLTPLLVGDRIGLHPVAVIFAILAGGQLFGFVGVLLALPVAAVIMVLLRHLHDRYKNSNLYNKSDSDQAQDESRP